MRDLWTNVRHAWQSLRRVAAAYVTVRVLPALGVAATLGAAFTSAAARVRVTRADGGLPPLALAPVRRALAIEPAVALREG